MNTQTHSGKVIAYYRVSTDKQGQSGLGLEAQRASVMAYLNGGSWQLLDEFIEVESGKINDRPKLTAALKRCKLTGATLVVAKLDRLSRNAAFLVGLMESQVRFVCADNPYANELTIHILAAVAQDERKRISERTRAALAAAKARGAVLGNPRLVECRNTDPRAATATRIAAAAAFRADVREVVADIRHEGYKSLHAIASELNRRGITARRGGQWTARQVQRVLA